MLKIKKKDTVVVKIGEDKGKQGEIIKIFTDSHSALVSKINYVKKHSKSSRQNPGGVIEKEAPIHISNLAIICPKCNQMTRIKFDRLQDGEKIRLCKKCGEIVV